MRFTISSKLYGFATYPSIPCSTIACSCSSRTFALTPRIGTLVFRPLSHSMAQISTAAAFPSEGWHLLVHEYHVDSFTLTFTLFVESRSDEFDSLAAVVGGADAKPSVA